MNVKQIVEQVLRQQKYDGLTDGCGCVCFVNDLLCCEDYCGQCRPGYAEDCPMDDTCNCGQPHIRVPQQFEQQ